MMPVLESAQPDDLEIGAPNDIQLCHQIALKLDVDETKFQRCCCNKKAGPPIMAVLIWAYEYCDRCEEKIFEQRQRLNELESMVFHLTCDVAII